MNEPTVHVREKHKALVCAEVLWVPEQMSMADKDRPLHVSMRGFKHCLHFEYCLASYENK